MPHILRLCLSFAVLLQLSWAAPVQANAAGEFICNPGGQAPSAETIAQIRDLFEAAGKDLPKETNPSEHCQDCIAPTLAALPSANTATFLVWPVQGAPIRSRFTTIIYAAQGPPLGGRAPPTFA